MKYLIKISFSILALVSGILLSCSFLKVAIEIFFPHIRLLNLMRSIAFNSTMLSKVIVGIIGSISS